MSIEKFLEEDKEPTTVVLRLNGNKYTISLSDELAFSFETINEDLIKHAAKMAFVCACFEEATYILEKARLDLTQLESLLYVGYKGTNGGSGKPLTEAMLKAMIDTDRDVIVKRSDIITYESYHRELKNVVKCFETRFFAMQSFVSTIRKSNT